MRTAVKPAEPTLDELRSVYRKFLNADGDEYYMEVHGQRLRIEIMRHLRYGTDVPVAELKKIVTKSRTKEFADSLLEGNPAGWLLAFEGVLG